MPRPKKKKVSSEKTADTVSCLLELAQAKNIPDNFFNGDIQDECEAEARIMAENINNGTLMSKLEFLIDHGYHPDRLRELIDEYLN